LGIFHTARPKNFLGFWEIRPHTSYRGFWNFDGFQETGFWHIDTHWVRRSGAEVHTGVNITREGISVKEDSVFIQDVYIPPATYDHAEAQIVANTNPGAWWQFRFRGTVGGYFGGDRLSLSNTVRFRVGETFNTEIVYRRDDVSLPEGDFVTNLFRVRAAYSFTPRIFLQGLIQYNDSQDIWSTNLRFGWLESANTGLFVVFNDVREVTSRAIDTQSRSFVVKYSRLFDLLN
ncbi:hydrolase, partial [bacterium]|nr:hydrolase [bacterium]